MNAEYLISDMIIPLRTSDTGEESLSMMNEFVVRHLPIVNNQQLLGLLSEDDILDHDTQEAVGSYRLSTNRPYVQYDDHVYEILRLIAEYRLTLIPVVDQENNYIGVVTMEDMIQYFARTASFSETGSIIVLEMDKRDYHLSEMARIVESEGAVILSSFITSNVDSTRLDVTLKLNQQNVQSIIATLNRFDYEVKATFNESTYVEGLKERYEGLMRYLNV
ncbi:MAG: CBS domain-containing protein [Bacteroidetes bacterium]|nr:CBS domain-containing protein [Bacteroidota bacterium]